ncbi:MAG: YihY/virulence factor BrkB family protein [Pirellulaceae bacterium]
MSEPKPEAPRPDVLSAAWMVSGGYRYAREVSGSLLLAVRRWQSDDAGSMAASVAYYLALSLFPMLLLLTSGLGLVLRFTRLGQDAQTQILSIVAQHCSPTLETQVQQILLQLRDQSIVGGPFGLLTAVLAAIGVFYQFERAFDKIWRIPTPPSRGIRQTILRVLTQRLAAFLLLAGVGLMMVAILCANVALGTVREWMTYLHVPGTIFVVLVDATATMIMNALAFGVLYRWLPKRPVQWSDAIRGGLLVSIIWELGRQVLSVFLIGMRYTSAYGVIGSFIALLLWFYWGVTILFFGAEYVQVLSRRHAKPLNMFNGRQTSGATSLQIAAQETFLARKGVTPKTL